MKKLSLLIFGILLIAVSCSKEEEENGGVSKDLTIFFINDQHGQLENFSKIAHIVSTERQSANVILACSGDMFSGNPVVDNHPEKGYPMIDLMNRVGFDIAVLGNHEYDYGEIFLADRMEQADFDWVCANVDMENTGIPEPFEYTTITVEDLKVTFLGLVETNGKENATIPSTHPWRVQNITFHRPESVVGQYADLKQQEDSDLYIALTHIGHNGNEQIMGDFQLAANFPYFDLIIGGHSHQEIDVTVNDIPVFQAGSYLNNLGKIVLTVQDKKISTIDFDLINLNSYEPSDSDIATVIEDYNDLPYLNEVIGYSHLYHYKNQVGCFYTDAMRAVMQTDITFQNSGGVRSSLDEGDIIKREIFEISPFNNGTVIYDMSVSDIMAFLKGSGSGFYYSGIKIEQLGNDVLIADQQDNIIPNDSILTVGVNDYIPAVHETYFPATGYIQTLTAAETLISYLVNIESQVNYPDCDRYFRFQK